METSSATALHNERLQRVASWRGQTSSAEEIIGSGRYGTVRASGDVAVKTVRVRCKRRSLQQPLREQASGLLQTLLLVENVTPHLVAHLGAEGERAESGWLLRHYYMERWPDSLDRCGGETLRDHADWLSLNFQILQALAAAGWIFGLSHNDVYPRNILIRSLDGREALRYALPDGGRLTLRPRFLAALTDFGISNAAAFDQPDRPDLAARCSLPPSFGRVAPTQHVLSYAELPAFYRDAYSLLKLTAFSSRPLPRAPKSAAAWARGALDLVDDRLRSGQSGSTLHLHLLGRCFPDMRDGGEDSGSEHVLDEATKRACLLKASRILPNLAEDASRTPKEK
jgi:hypothetical protein